MFFLSFSQVLGLLLFFLGWIVLNHCSKRERLDFMDRSLPESTGPARGDYEERELTRQLLRKSVVYSFAGLFVAFFGMVLFFFSAS